uniref:CCHC-type domain-containing protein n=1 Tax=Phytophthora ramorum TaxID=164328 RepID=H3GTF6_PHYRM
MEPFDGSNYTLWSYKMKMYQMSKGLWEAVEGKAEASSSKEQQAHAAIVLNLNDSQLMHVVTAKSAKEAWEKLEKFHRAQDVANRLWLKEKFSSFKFTTSSVSKHVTELEQLVLEMKSAGCEPSDEDVCATLLRSLPASYESLVQAFRMSMTELKLADLVGKLIAEEVRQKDSTRIKEATALLANKGYAKDTKKKQQGGRRKLSGACFNCGKMGHYARDCRSKASPENEVLDESNVTFNVTEMFASESWVMDSGASTHMCKTREAFEDYTPMTKSYTATAHGVTVIMTQDKCVIKRGDVSVATGRKIVKLMYLNTDAGEECHIVEEDVGLWHRRLGHASFQTLNDMIKDGRISGTPAEKGNVCGVCATAKQVRKTFHSNKGELEARESKRTDDIVCSDVLGPITPASKSGYKYIVTFIMMKSRYVTIYPLRMKSEVHDAFAKFLKEIKVTAGLTVKILRSDKGGEYRIANMDALCDAKTIKQEFTVPYNPQHNGMSERMNRTLVEMTRCMLKESGLDKSYWCEAIMTATDIRNVLPNTSNPHASPFEMVFKRKPRLDHMRVFGSECYASVTKEKRKKLDDSGVKCYFLGYAKQSKAYRLLNDSDGSIVVSRSITFAEHSSDKVATEKGDVIDIIGEDDDKDTQDEQGVDDGFSTPTMEPQQEPQQSEHAGPTHAVPT